MAEVIWTEEARNRLNEIVAYIAEDSPRNALRVEEGIIEASRRMETLPLGGGLVEELREYGIREIYYGIYRILYKVQGDVCYVVCVIHGSRELLANVNPVAWSEE